MRILVCDDEPFWVNRITQLLHNYPDHKFTIISSSIEKDIISIVTHEKFDLAYLDILLQDINGIDIAKTLIKVNPLCLIIFVTNYQEYVSDAFTLKVFQYLFKPIDEKLFYHELHRAYQKYKTLSAFYPINTTEGKQYIQPTKIMYIETYYKTISIICEHETYKSHIKNLKYLKTFFHEYDFGQTHQSYYVNMNHIQKLQRHFLILHNGLTIPISISRRTKVQNTFYTFIMEKEKY
mgnify:CR=1 FL=1